MPLEAIRWKLAERFGWTLEQVDALSINDLHDLDEFDEGRNKAHGVGVKVYGAKGR